MKTLIELYDERAIENVLAPDMFRPEEVVYLCPEEIWADREHLNRQYGAFFYERGWSPRLTFLYCSPYDGEMILKQLLRIVDTHEDCALDVTGGTDAALFAAGMLAAQRDIPAFTYSRKMNCFYNIRNADFADRLPCDLVYGVEECFLMAGGRLRPGRVNNSILKQYLPLYDPFFQVYLKHRRQWPHCVNYMQAVAQEPGEAVRSPLKVTGIHGKAVTMEPELLKELLDLQMLKELRFEQDGQVAFNFADEQNRAWLRDVGSVLELYVYKACLDAGIFDDVVSSAVVDWDGEAGKESVSNEIDAMATRGVLPLFISCKTCAIKTEALNELAILRDRFGGKGAKAVIVTSENCNAAARHRAAQLGIAVIDLEELLKGEIVHRLKVIMKAEE